MFYIYCNLYFPLNRHKILRLIGGLCIKRPERTTSPLWRQGSWKSFRNQHCILEIRFVTCLILIHYSLNFKNCPLSLLHTLFTALFWNVWMNLFCFCLQTLLLCVKVVVSWGSREALVSYRAPLSLWTLLTRETRKAGLLSQSTVRRNNY